jgi:XapX domain-containing protein
MIKQLLALVLAFIIGFACRYFGIPSPAPNMFIGALLVMVITLGAMVAERVFPGR